MFHTYQPFASCTGKSQPGTQNLSAAVDALWSEAITGFPYGIYNCRPPSLHGEGRAVDIGFPGVAHPQGTALASVLVKNAWNLGLQVVIWNRKKWSRRYPVGITYTGPSPHTDHVHVEQVWSFARTNPLSLATAKLYLGVPVAFTSAEETALKSLAAWSTFLTGLASAVSGKGPTTQMYGNSQSLLHLLEVHRLVAADAGVSGLDHEAIKKHLLGET